MFLKNWNKSSVFELNYNSKWHTIVSVNFHSLGTFTLYINAIVIAMFVVYFILCWTYLWSLYMLYLV